MALAGMCLSLFGAKAAQGPIRVSPNGRYFVDAQGEPFYFLADTQWELFRRYSLSEAKLILENRKAKGFSVVMVMLTGVGSGTGPNLEGQHPWLNDNPATPNPDYFTHVDAVVKLAQENDLHLLIGIYHQTYGSRHDGGQCQIVGSLGHEPLSRFAQHHLDDLSEGDRQLPSDCLQTRRGHSGRRRRPSTSSRFILIRRPPAPASCTPSPG
jgi:hypothetical protein